MIESFKRTGGSLLAAVLLTSFAACGDSTPTVEAPGTADPPTTEGELPPDHPPVNDPSTSIAPPPPGSGQGSSGLAWTPPADWLPEAPSNAMRRAQYRVPATGGDGECVIYYFGPGQGGDATSNAERWAGQFSQVDGTPSMDRMLSERFSVGDIEVLMVEVTGTYNSAMAMGGPTESLPGYMLLGAIAEGTDANWFFKFTGPEETLAAQREAFEGMIRSLSSGA